MVGPGVRYTPPVRPARLAFFAFFLACAGAPPVAPAPEPPPPARTATGDASIRQLVLDLAVKEACSRTRNKWIGLPSTDPGGAVEGAAEGLVGISGRWLIRDCKEDVVQAGQGGAQGPSLHLHLAGPGWQWVDQTSSGFRVHQYVYFSASVDLETALDVGYDPRTQIATLWLTPTDQVGATVEALGKINAHPETLLAAVEGGIGSALGMNPDEVARAQAGTLGAEQFRAHLSHGATLTYDTRVGQLDLFVGQLPNGVVPRRPFDDATPWILNEREKLFPAGFQVLGPFDAGASSTLEAIVEEGAGMTYRAICQSDMQSAIDAVVGGGTLPGFQGTGAVAVASGAHDSWTLAPLSCPWVLVIAPPAGATVASTVSLRMQQAEGASAASAGAGPAAAVVSGTAWVQPTLVSFEFHTTRPDGKSWDIAGGAPDPEISLVTPRGSRLLVSLKDAFSGQPNVRTDPVEVSATMPLRLRAVDKDIEFDDPMGEATLTLEDIQRHMPDVVAEFRLDGVATGRATLHMDVAVR
jgi:hypothetical protein